jgi:FAD/FMN-containing dehydrogenase
VHDVVVPRSVDALGSLLLDARSSGRPVSVAGGRHAMGGQQFGGGTILVDTRGLDRFITLDAESGHVTAEGGIEWPALFERLEHAQRGCSRQWGIYQKQTGADRLTLAGALSCNAHGRGLTLPPIVGQVESFQIVEGGGELKRCSRTSHPDLFALAIGGYGLFGIITQVTLRLKPRSKVRRVVSVEETDGLMDRFADRIRSGFEYGDFQFAIDSGDETFMRRGVFSCYEPVAPRTPLTKNPLEFLEHEWTSLIIDAHTNKRRAFDRYVARYLQTSGQIYWSDAQLNGPYVDGYHEEVDRSVASGVSGSEMITELYVPRDCFEAFMDAARGALRERRANVIYGTVRLIERDTETFLAWAREPYACVVLNLHVDHTSSGIANATGTFRELIDVAINHGGSYYLTYHRWARKDQVQRCYPQMERFLRAKREYDPGDIFQSNWYRAHRALFQE